MKRLSAIFPALILCAGCAMRPQYLAPSFAPPKSVAVLPVSGRADDPRAYAYVRRTLIENLKRRGYPCLSADQVDAALSAKLGGASADQVKAASAEALRAALADADAVVSAEFLEYRFEQSGVNLDKAVRLKFTMTDLKTGEKLWEQETEDRESEMNRDQDAVKASLAPDWFGRGYTPLQQQMYGAVARAVLSLPSTANRPAKKGLLW